MLGGLAGLATQGSFMGNSGGLAGQYPLGLVGEISGINKQVAKQGGFRNPFNLVAQQKPSEPFIFLPRRESNFPKETSDQRFPQVIPMPYPVPMGGNQGNNQGGSSPFAPSTPPGAASPFTPSTPPAAASPFAPSAPSCPLEPFEPSQISTVV